MKFDVKQQFDADAAAVIGCYSSAEMYEQLPEFARSADPTCSTAEHGDTVKIRLRYKFTADLPTAALAIIDPDRLTWVEETTYDSPGLRRREAPPRPLRAEARGCCVGPLRRSWWTARFGMSPATCGCGCSSSAVRSSGPSSTASRSTWPKKP